MTLKEQAESMGIKVDGRWSEERIQEEVNKSKAIDKFKTVEWATERAKAIWEGQSPGLSMVERVGRIKAALKDKGFTDFDNLTMPVSGAKRYL